MPKRQSNRQGKKMVSKGWGEAGRKKKVDGDLAEGLGRAHAEDFLGLDDQSEENSDEENENPVFDLMGDDEDEDDEDDMDEEELTGLEAKLMKQSKIMRQKAELEEDDDEVEEEEEEEEERAVWGKSKKLYYSADNVDYELQSDDDEAPAEEEAEVLRLQQKAAASLRLEDFEQDDDGGVETLQEAVKRNEGMSSERPGKRTEAIIVEEVKKDIHGLSKEEKMDVLMRDAPELVSLLSEFREALDELQNKVQPLVKKVKYGQSATNEGKSYLEVKQLLLLNYCQSLAFYLLLKADGRSVRDHPVILRLVELRFFLEKIRPIDKKLAYQIDKLLKTANASAQGSGEHSEDALKYRPPELLVNKTDEDAQAGGGVYGPPLIAPMAIEEDLRPRNQMHKDCEEKESQRRASRGSFTKEMANKLGGSPEEIQEIVGIESREMMREKARLDARAKEEEELFTRVPLSRVEQKKLKHLQQPKSGLYDLLDDFDDNLGMGDDRIGVSHGGPPDDLLKPPKLSKIIAESGKPAKKMKVISGDADLPTREDLGERRRIHEMRKVQPYDGDAGSGEDHKEFEPEEDEFYKEAKHLAGAWKAAKCAKYAREPNVPSVQQDEEGKRHITNMMEKNRGLTPHRKKLTKNPRKKYKLKHDKANIRRKGQVRAVKAGGGSYGGETTGIRTNLSRSIRIQN